jgi:hypothetical protein
LSGVAMIKSALTLFLCIVLTVGFAGPTSAETLRLEFCKENYYTYEVYEVRIDISNSAKIQDGFDLEFALGDGTATGTTRVEPVRDNQGRRWWEGRSSLGFSIKEADIRPKIPGFIVSGPESCRYQVVYSVEDPTKKICAARYSFSARQVRVALRADPPEAAVRLKRGTISPRSSKGCTAAHSRKRSPADEKIAAEVQAALAADRSLDSFIVEVDVQDGIVELSGLVNTPDAKKKAYEIASKTPGVRSVKNSNALKADLPYDGTSTMELGMRTITIERVRGKEVLFFATIDVPADFPTKDSFSVSRNLLEEAVARRFAASEDSTQHGRSKDLLKKALEGLSNIQSITIQRTDEW